MGTTTQVTTATEDFEQNTDPAVSGSLVVWTHRMVAHDDAYFCDITDCAGTVRPVAPPIPTQRRFNDVSGTLIAYTELISPTRVVKVYDVVSGVTKASPGTNDANPRIDGHTVVYERGLSPGASIYALDITNDVESAVFTYSGGPQGINPAVSGTRVVYQRNSDIILHDLATGQDIDVEAGPDPASRPDIDGDTVVYEFTTSTGDFDIAIYRVSTGTTTRIQRPGDQRGPHVSGGVVVFDDDTSGFSRSNIGLYHIPTGTMQFIGEADASDRLNDISGHRVVYQSNRDGNNDIYLYEFDVQMPEIDVAPTTHDFGDVNLGASASTIATISNVGALPLTVSSVAFGAGSNAAFTATFPGAVPTHRRPRSHARRSSQVHTDGPRRGWRNGRHFQR